MLIKQFIQLFGIIFGKAVFFLFIIQDDFANKVFHGCFLGAVFECSRYFTLQTFGKSLVTFGSNDREFVDFMHLVTNLPQERLSIAVACIGAAQAALNWTVEYCKERTAFGQPIGSFQNSRFKLAEMRTEIEIGTQYVDQCVMALNAGRLSAEDAAMAKWWCSELQKRTVDTCVQLHGGYGYMLEYPIARAYVDARITTIYGGTTEIMKEIIGRKMGF